uniref:(northern house mosquito) hypothetical protein n=1 Tax=Culex pipiens TaxID=7175 RepID=A0A8D8CNR7_CULPI
MMQTKPKSRKRPTNVRSFGGVRRVHGAVFWTSLGVHNVGSWGGIQCDRGQRDLILIRPSDPLRRGVKHGVSRFLSASRCMCVCDTIPCICATVPWKSGNSEEKWKNRVCEEA